MRFIVFSLGAFCLAACPSSLKAQESAVTDQLPLPPPPATAPTHEVGASAHQPLGVTQDSGSAAQSQHVGRAPPTEPQHPVVGDARPTRDSQPHEVGWASPTEPQDPAARSARPASSELPSLKPPSQHEQLRHGSNGWPEKLQPLGALGGSLAAVLGVFFLLAWLMRKTAPQGSAVLPDEVFEVLGRASLSNRQQLQLLRCGGKLLLVSVTATGAETLTEITDAEEVERLAELCRQGQSQGAATAFRRVCEQLAAKRESRSQRFGDGTAAEELSASYAAGGRDGLERWDV